MKRAPLYSSSRRVRDDRSGPDLPPGEHEGTSEPSSSPIGGGGVPSLRSWYDRYERPVLLSAGVGTALLAMLLYGSFLSSPDVRLTQRDIDQAVLYTLGSLPPSPSEESVAFSVIRPSVVSVRRLDPGADGSDPEPEPPEDGFEMDAEGPETEQGIGTGVVIVDDGTILTNLHVVAGAERLGVIFADGTESPADLISVQPEQDLAVIRARILPDDLIPATLASTRDLHVGDRVVAVGFPFGIGPSLSAGVVSGLRRDYRGADGERILSDLIQFDAAVNPGNSGGPLVNMEGQVVGIVTALLNPSNQRVFIGIGFAVPIETAAAGAGMSPF